MAHISSPISYCKFRFNVNQPILESAPCTKYVVFMVILVVQSWFCKCSQPEVTESINQLYLQENETEIRESYVI